MTAGQTQFADLLDGDCVIRLKAPEQLLTDLVERQF